MAAAAYERSQHLAVLDAEGSSHPPHNYLGITETFKKFRAEFLTLSPLIDPRGRRVVIRETNFPKFLNLRHKDPKRQRKAHTILEEIDAGTFHEENYEYEMERLRSLFWIPDVIGDPDAIYKMKPGSVACRLKRST
jgi:hypothetical protein